MLISNCICCLLQGNVQTQKICLGESSLIEEDYKLKKDLKDWAGGGGGGGGATFIFRVSLPSFQSPAGQCPAEELAFTSDHVIASYQLFQEVEGREGMFYKNANSSYPHSPSFQSPASYCLLGTVSPSNNTRTGNQTRVCCLTLVLVQPRQLVFNWTCLRYLSQLADCPE